MNLSIKGIQGESMSDINETTPQGKSNPMAIISLISGILSIVILLAGICLPCVMVLSLIFGPLGAILGFISKKKIAESSGEQTGSGLAVGGIVTGLIGTVGAVVAVILFIASVGLIAGTGLMYPEILNFFDSLN
jgi:hypothetical protein